MLASNRSTFRRLAIGEPISAHKKRFELPSSVPESDGPGRETPEAVPARGQSRTVERIDDRVRV
jgi:hypothetical protein